MNTRKGLILQLHTSLSVYALPAVFAIGWPDLFFGGGGLFLAVSCFTAMLRHRDDMQNSVFKDYGLMQSCLSTCSNRGA